ncbi:MAG TPA: LytTR family DNA-binding domain-containing protein [Bacteroidota bacterium]|nr:LytTR family DNA-binding domain-containing protein [Bacteroidota bacterium]
MSPPPSTRVTSQKIRTLIVDDEPLARDKIRMFLERDPEIEIIGECVDGVHAVRSIEESSPDLLFLDIQMPGKDGFEVLRTVGVDRVAAVIFVTAYDEHALRAFEFHALDYLLKPFAANRFQDALARAKTQLLAEPAEPFKKQLMTLLGSVDGESRYITRLVVKTGGRIVFLKVEEIDWIEAAGNYLTLHVGTSSHLIRETMNDLESRLDPAQFLRIHRSTIVNIDRIKEMQPLFHGDFTVMLMNGTRLMLSRNYKSRLPRHLGKLS